MYYVIAFGFAFSCKNKGVFTIPLTVDPNKSSNRLPGDAKSSSPNSSGTKVFDTKTGQWIEPKGVHNSSTLQSTPRIDFKAPEPIKPEIEAQAKALGLGRRWTRDEIMSHAHELLKLDKTDLDIPDWVFMGATGEDKERITNVVFRLFHRIVKELGDGKIPAFFTDGDGTKFYKSPMMVASTSSQASIQDRLATDVLSYCLYLMGVPFSLLTARPGITAGQSIVGTEETVNDLKTPNQVSFEEISSCIGEGGEIPKGLGVNVYGLSGGITSIEGEPVKISEPTLRYMKLMNFMSQPGNITEKGFLQEFLDLRFNDGDSIRTCEFKAIPQAFLLIPDLTSKQYHRYMEVAKQSREESWTAQKFISEVDGLGINFPPKLRALLNPNDVESEVKLTEIMRDGASSIACLVPHFIDGNNVYRNDLRLKFYDLILKYTRDPKTQAWMNKEFGIPIGTDVVTVNKKDISSLKNFNADIKGDIYQFVNKGHKELPDVKHKFAIINMIDNNQFYAEMSPANTKDEVVPRYQEALQDRTFPIFCGDSAGSDAPAAAQAVISGGIAVIVRGLMTKKDVAAQMFNLLVHEDANGKHLNEGHTFCLKDIGGKKYQRLNTGEIKSKEEWIDELHGQYSDDMFQLENIHLNNAVLAYTFRKFFENEKFPVDLSSIQELDKKDKTGPLRYRTLTTPDVGFLEKNLQQYFPQPLQSLDSRFSWVKKIPLIGPSILELMKIQNSRPVMTKLISFLSWILMGSGGVGIAGHFLGKENVVKWSRITQSIAGIANNFASGITRGLRSPTRYPGQFFGEMCSLISNLFPQESFAHKALWALANSLLQLGRAAGTIQSENTCLDKYKPGTEKKVEEAFGSQKDFASVTNVAQAITKDRIAWIKKIRPYLGDLVAETVADMIQGLRMTWQWITVPAYRQGSISSFFKNTGFTKTSTVSGKDYTNVASVSHQYAASGVLSMGAMLLSMITRKLKIPGLDYVLTALAQVIPTFGMMTGARHVAQDAHGYTRLFTDTQGRQGAFNPERAGAWQKIGTYIQAIGGLFHESTPAQLGLMAGLGAYLQGVSREFDPILEGGAINTLRKTAPAGQRFTSYFDIKNDSEKSPHIVEHTKKFFGRDTNSQLHKTQVAA